MTSVEHFSQQFLSHLSNKRFSHWLVPALILLSGLFLRLYNWENFGFVFDQAQIMENAERITHGDLTLIGPRTGPIPMFTGPLIYYITAIWLLIIPHPSALILTTFSISLITAIVIFWFVQQAINRRSALAILALWAGSPFLVAMDRTTWNPNLSIVASSLVFFPLLRLIQKEKISLSQDWGSFVAIFSGAFLGYQAHFSGLILPILALSSCLLLRKFRTALPVSISAGLGLGLSLLPTLLFDLRNQWLNVKGLQTLGERSSDTSLWTVIIGLSLTISAALSTLGRLFLGQNYTLLPSLLGIGLVIWYSIFLHQGKQRKNRASHFLPLLWIIVTVLLYTFYHGDTPEYYFLILVPAMLVVVERTLLTWLRERQVEGIFLLVLAFYSLFSVMQNTSKGLGLSIGNQTAIVNFITDPANNITVSEIAYDMPAEHTFGLRYILKDIETSSAGAVLHVTYPHQPEALATYRVNDVGIWLDSRTNPEYHYVTQPTYILGSPLHISLYPQLYPGKVIEIHDSYKITVNGIEFADLVVVPAPLRESKTWSLWQVAREATENEWNFYDTPEFTGWAFRTKRHLLLVSGVANTSDTKKVLQTIQVLY